MAAPWLMADIEMAISAAASRRSIRRISFWKGFNITASFSFQSYHWLPRERPTAKKRIADEQHDGS